MTPQVENPHNKSQDERQGFELPRLDEKEEGGLPEESGIVTRPLDVSKLESPEVTALRQAGLDAQADIVKAASQTTGDPRKDKLRMIALVKAAIRGLQAKGIAEEEKRKPKD